MNNIKECIKIYRVAQIIGRSILYINKKNTLN